MNHVYRLSWNQSQQTYVPAPETARGRHKQGGRAGSRKNARTTLVGAAVAAALMGATAGVHALPIGGQVSSGTASLAQSGAALTVNQSSQKLALNWQNFSIAGNETVKFMQPNASAIALNRVLGSDPSAIYGKLSANGQVFLINPNGILFGKGAQVNVGGLVASTLNLGDADFRAGKRTFSGSGGAVANQGSISAAGGYIALLGGQVSNQGTLQANLGTVALAAGTQTTLDFAGDKLIKVQVDQGALHALAENRQLVQADGGTVILTARAADHLVAAVVNNTGLIQARTLENHGGVISLLGDMQSVQVNVGGTLDASAPTGGNGGFIETSAATVKVANDARVSTAAPNGRTGTWLIDPQDYTVAASGGDITGAALGTNLGSTNVILQSSSGATAGAGNVNVNDAVSWSANTTLTLTASNNVNVNAAINASGSTAGLAINPNTANGAEAASGAGSFNLGAGAAINLPNVSPTSTTALLIGATPYTVINSLGVAGDSSAASLQGINGNLAGHYALGSNIDATGAAAWNGQAGFAPIGYGGAGFTGTFDGLGHTINGLTVNAPSSSYVGLFGSVGSGGRVQNLGLAGGSVNGSAEVGGLAGVNSGTISNAYASGSVNGSSAGYHVGGLVGLNWGTINKAYATANVSGSSWVGGLAGLNFGTVSNAYAMGSVSGGSWVGGLVGANFSTVGNAYATGSVSGSNWVGGLAGLNDRAISNAYATGSVSGGSSVGGLVGLNYGTVSNSFWDTTTAGQSSSAGGTGLTTAQMQTGANFSSPTSANGNANPAWDFSRTWIMYDGYTAPLLRSFMTPLTVTANSASRTYDGQAYSAANSVTYSITPNSNLLGTVSYSSTAQGATNAGTYAITPSGLYSTQQQGGYAIDFVSGALTVNPAPLTLQGTMAATNKVYDGSTAATLTGSGTLSGVIAGDTVTLSASGNFATRNAGTGIAVVPSLGGASAGNYIVIQPTGLSADITPKALTVDGSTGAASKTYDGTATATMTANLSGLIGGDSVALAGNFADKNVGIAKTVTYGNSLTGADAGNYSLSSAGGTTTSDIIAKVLTVSGATVASNKVYDATTGATVSGGTIAISGIIAGDTVSFAQSGNFADKNVGTSKTVTYSNSLSGTDAGNYSLSSAGGTVKANIAAKALTVLGAVAASKVYDGSTAAALTGNLSGVIAGDTVSLAQSGTFANKNVGTAKAVTYKNSLSGTDKGNYSLSSAGGMTTADITAKSLTVTGTSVADKVYDGTIKASLTGGTLSGVVSGDTVKLTQSGVFAAKNAGTGIAVTATDSLGGASAGNYSLVEPSTLTASITRKQLKVGATVAANKVYDATTTATLSGGTVTGLITGDAVSFAQAGSFADKNVGKGKTVAFSNYLAGADAGNYSLSSLAGSVKANISAKLLTVGGATVAANKVYDGTTAATVSGASIAGLIDGDMVSLTQSGTFASKTIGTAKVVTYKNSLTGTDGGNYSLSSTGGKTTANITR